MPHSASLLFLLGSLRFTSLKRVRRVQRTRGCAGSAAQCPENSVPLEACVDLSCSPSVNGREQLDVQVLTSCQDVLKCSTQSCCSRAILHHASKQGMPDPCRSGRGALSGAAGAVEHVEHLLTKARVNVEDSRATLRMDLGFHTGVILRTLMQSL